MHPSPAELPMIFRHHFAHMGGVIEGLQLLHTLFEKPRRPLRPELHRLVADSSHALWAPEPGDGDADIGVQRSTRIGLHQVPLDNRCRPWLDVSVSSSRGHRGACGRPVAVSMSQICHGTCRGAEPLIFIQSATLFCPNIKIRTRQG